MSEPKLSYRLLPNDTGWYWEIFDSEKTLVDRGIADECARARADAFKAAFDRLQISPE